MSIQSKQGRHENTFIAHARSAARGLRPGQCSGADQTEERPAAVELAMRRGRAICAQPCIFLSGSLVYRTYTVVRK
jgi:hypothetical protein